MKLMPRSGEYAQTAIRLAAILVALLMLVSVVGCHRNNSIQAPATLAPITSRDYLNAQPPPTASDKTPYSRDMAQLIADKGDATLAKADRNTIVYSLMGEIDKVYGEFDVRLHSGKAMESVGFDAITLGLSTAATIATNSPTKTLLSALGTGIGGLGQSVDKNFFASQTFQVLSIAMANRREKIRTVIISNLTTQDLTSYPLPAAKRDLIAYYYAGTLAGGLDELQQEASAASKNSVSQTVATPVMDPVDGTYTTPASVSIACSTPGATIYYTIDGSVPNTSSSTYSAPIQTKDGQTIKALGVLPGLTNSQVASATYKVDAVHGLDPTGKKSKPISPPAMPIY